CSWSSAPSRSASPSVAPPRASWPPSASSASGSALGIGGDYLLSATIMSEYANKKTRGAFIAVVFTTQGFGILTGGTVSIIISAAFKERFDYPAYRDDRAGSTVPEADYIWVHNSHAGRPPGCLNLLLADEDARDRAVHCSCCQERETGGPRMSRYY
ncbi:unnamed protein product, partial [Musa hybrid cultivar]